MTFTFSLLEAPRVEPVTLEEARQFLRLEEQEDDSLLKRMIASARIGVENYTNRALIFQTWRACYEGRGPFNKPPSLISPCGTGLRIILPRTPFCSLEGPLRLQTAKGERGLTAYSLIRAHSCGMIIVRTPLLEGDILTIDFTVGYGNEPQHVPAPFQQAILMWVAEMYENRQASRLTGSKGYAPSSEICALLAPLRFMAWL